MIYFSKPNGIGNGISIEQAGEFTEIVNKLQAGDVLYMLGGIYHYTKQITLHLNGEANKEILIIADDCSNLPVFDFRWQPYGSNADSDCNGFRLFGEYAHINGLIVRYAGYKGIRSELNNSTLENIEVYGCCDSGIQVSSGGHNTLINCVSHDNFGYKTVDFGVVKFGYNSDGISDKLHYGLPNRFINCRSYNNTDDGFDFFGRCTEEFTYIDNCESHHNGISMFDMTDYPRYGIDREWFDTFKEPQPMKTINGGMVITLTEYPAFGNGNGFKLGGKKRYHCVELHNCIASNNRMKGFDQNHNSGIMRLYDCYAEENQAFDYGFRDKMCGTAYFNHCSSKKDNVSIKCKQFECVGCSWKDNYDVDKINDICQRIIK